MKPLLLSLTIILFTSPTRVFARDYVVAKVNGSAIKQSEVYRRLWDLKGVEVLDRLIERKIIEQEAETLKISADREMVEWRIDQIKAKAQLPEGTSLEDRLAASGVSMEALRSDIAFELLRNKVVVETAHLSVSSTAMYAFFENNKEQFGTPAAFQLYSLRVPAEQDVRDILLALKNGADFKKLAMTKSMDAATRKEGGFMGWISPGMLHPKIEEVLEGLYPGEISPVVRTSEGFFLFLMGHKREAVEGYYGAAPHLDIYNALMTKKIEDAYPRVLQALKKKFNVQILPRPDAG